MKKIVLLFLGVCIGSGVVSGQESTWPIPGYTSIVGTFGEFRDTHFHGGIDIAADNGSTIVSAGSGTVTVRALSGSVTTGYGYIVVISHDDGICPVQFKLQPSPVEMC
jgi:murein DD-endopeptidase MepM/ murein hydrolase activator NlpD